MKIAVVGGGVVGLAVAQRLTSQGAEVVVLERGVCGHAASLGNAGWVTPILSVPLGGPGVLRKSLRWMLDPTSPLLVRPRLDPSFLLWCLRFARSCTRSRFEQAARALVALNATTLEAFDVLRSDGVVFEMHDDGLLLAALDEHELEHAWQQFQWLSEIGYAGPLELLDGPAMRALEPTVSAGVAGAIYAGAERHVRPETLTAGLVSWLRQRGVELHENTPVERLTRSGRGWALETHGGEQHVVDSVVVAAGVWTRNLLRGLGARIPLEGAKGYSVTLETNGTAPRRPVMLLEAKVAVSPFDGGVRIAGTLELAGENLTLNARRIRAILDAVSRYLTSDVSSAGVEWAGLRPLLPDSLPVIGRVPGAPGVFAATGHAMLGVTLAPATANLLATVILEDRPLPVLEPLRADRRY